MSSLEENTRGRITPPDRRESSRMSRRTWQAAIVYTLAAVPLHLASGSSSLFTVRRHGSRRRSVAVLVGARLGSANAVRASELAAERPHVRRQHLLPGAPHPRLLRSSAAAGAGALAVVRPHARCGLLLQRVAGCARSSPLRWRCICSPGRWCESERAAYVAGLIFGFAPYHFTPPHTHPAAGALFSAAVVSLCASALRVRPPHRHGRAWVSCWGCRPSARSTTGSSAASASPASPSPSRF